MTLHVKIPSYCQQESAYIIDVLLQNFLGLNYQLSIHDKPIFMIEMGGKLIESPATFFLNAHNHWLSPDTLPELPLQSWDIKSLPLSNKLINNNTGITNLIKIN